MKRHAPHRRGRKYLPLEQLAISPQCGFDSDVSVQPDIEDDRAASLERGWWRWRAGSALIFSKQH